jgi:hypothetical protein
MISQPPPPPNLITPFRSQPHPLAKRSTVTASITLAGLFIEYCTLAILHAPLLGGAAYDFFYSSANTVLLVILLPLSLATVLPAITGIIVGHIGLRRITESSGGYRGERQTAVALTICYFGLVLTGINVVIGFVTLVYDMLLKI